jgi:hypothetical protein
MSPALFRRGCRGAAELPPRGLVASRAGEHGTALARGSAAPKGGGRGRECRGQRTDQGRPHLA